MSSKLLFFSSFSLILAFSYWVGDGVLYPLGAGVFLSLLYLVLVGVVFFFHTVPEPVRRVAEAAVLVALFASFHVFPPLSLSAIPALFFVLLYPVYLGWRHRIFMDFIHVALWLALSTALSAALYTPLPKTLWGQVLAAISSTLAAHYILLKIYPRLKRR
jgi:hypothetical protein